MKRDWDLVRAILTGVEAQPAGSQINLSTIAGWDHAAVLEHASLLVESHYLNGKTLRDGARVAMIVISGLTMSGYDLLDTMRSEPVWSKVKDEAKSKGIELTFDAIKSIAAWALGQLLGSG